MFIRSGDTMLSPQTDSVFGPLWQNRVTDLSGYAGNGGKFIAYSAQCRFAKAQIETDSVAPGILWEYFDVESCNGKLRDELLHEKIFAR